MNWQFTLQKERCRCDQQSRLDSRWLCHKTGLSNSLLSSFQRPTKVSRCLVTKSCSHSFVTPCTTARQAPLSVAFSRQEYWRGLPCPPLQGIFPVQGSNASLLFGRWVLYHPATWQPQSSVSPIQLMWKARS